MEPYRALINDALPRRLFFDQVSAFVPQPLPQSRVFRTAAVAGKFDLDMSTKGPRPQRSGNSEVPTPGETAVADTEAREAQFATTWMIDSEPDWDDSESSSDSAVIDYATRQFSDEEKPNLDIKLEGAGAEAETAVAVDNTVARARKSRSPLRGPRQKKSSEKQEQNSSEKKRAVAEPTRCENTRRERRMWGTPGPVARA